MTTTTELITSIPKPPPGLLNTSVELFTPAPELDDFVRDYFLNEDSPLFNEDHFHLQTAQIGWLWTNVELQQKQKTVAGMASLPTVQGNKWTKGIYNQQLRQWFGDVNLSFKIIINARIANDLSPGGFCALLEHELYHCAQARDQYGELQFDDETGLPKFGIRGHDVEEFVGIMRRYGVDACAGETREFIAASRVKPLFNDVKIESICGNCLALKP